MDTSIGRGAGAFPSTRWSRIVGGEAAEPDWNALAQRYWRPVYGYLRRRWRQSNEDAKDWWHVHFPDGDPLNLDKPHIRV